MLSSVERWDKRDGKFNLDHFFQIILEFFDPDIGLGEEWISETLAWWNK